MSTSFIPVGDTYLERFGGATLTPQAAVEHLSAELVTRRLEALESFLKSQGADPARHTLVTYHANDEGAELNVLVPHSDAAALVRDGLAPERARSLYPYVEIQVLPAKIN